MSKNGTLYSWRPIRLLKGSGEDKNPYPKFVDVIEGKMVYWYPEKYDFYFGPNIQNEKKISEKPETFLVLTGINAASGIVRSRQANRKLIESTVQSPNSAASKLARIILMPQKPFNHIGSTDSERDVN